MNPLILITNDDGINSPGLGAVAEAVHSLGELLIVAPQVQQTSMGRSRTQQCGGDGTISKTTVIYGGNQWEGYSVKATPALAVVHAVKELADREISLAISGINYGENVASCVTVSGTIGAALEAADMGIPTLAVSQEIDGQDYHSYSSRVNFSAAIHFTRLIAQIMLNNTMPFDADVLKLEIPLGATRETRFVVTRQDRLPYYQSNLDFRENLFGTQNKVYDLPSKGEYSSKNTDAYALSQGLVSITPLSLDLTSRKCLDEIAKILNTSILKKDQ